MNPRDPLPDDTLSTERAPAPVSYVPTPSAAYRQHRKSAQLLDEPGAPRHGPGANDTPAPRPIPLPFAFGARVLMWKQDPSVSEIGTRKAFLPGIVLDGPRDARIISGDPGIAPVSPNAFGDFIATPDSPQFDAVHTFAVVRQTLTMYQRALSAAGNDMPLPWQWNSSVDTSPIQVFPYGLPNVMNAFYSRSQGCLKFGDFVPDGKAERVFTCRSFDIVAHETGHAVLDGLKPDWLGADNPPQTGGLHESFGDLTAIFLALSQLDQCEAVIAQTKARLHDKTFLADIAEQFGLALGTSTGLRNADNDLTLSDAGTEVHALSQVFTGAVYDILADLFAFERNPALQDDAVTLHGVGAYLGALVLRALVAAPDVGATYADVVNQMLRLCAEDARPIEYRNSIRNRFTLREVVESPVPLAEDYAAQVLLPGVQDSPGAVQDRRACCGTMNLAEYYNLAHVLDAEAQALARWCAEHGRDGPAMPPEAPPAPGDDRPDGEKTGAGQHAPFAGPARLR
ncbi:hypothetical protein [Massilia psychrophila]|uniref:hypothetical protein n=1 Tax=Massilia psychrophila TaxID=1603353 RepID=UPI0019903AF0|nr:hypothetical protein [Massilia psychrophila]GGE65198.1 hypothetical protein GCM10008020_06830 [Massilia psychrophila]